MDETKFRRPRALKLSSLSLSGRMLIGNEMLAKRYLAPEELEAFRRERFMLGMDNAISEQHQDLLAILAAKAGRAADSLMRELAERTIEAEAAAVGISSADLGFAPVVPLSRGRS